MASAQKEMEGRLFVNNKEGNERAPDYTGQALIEGVYYRMAAWENQAQSDGRTWFRLTFQPKVAAAAPAAPTPNQSPDPNDEIPF